jgi:uncharacterized membrane protein HdeD (DUF308 family)
LSQGKDHRSNVRRWICGGLHKPTLARAAGAWPPRARNQIWNWPANSLILVTGDVPGLGDRTGRILMAAKNWNLEPGLAQGTGWGWILAYGILLAIVGIVALLEPLATGLATGLFIGFVLLSGGVLGLAAGFSGKGWRSRWLDIVLGLLSLALGLLVLWHPFAGAFSLVWFIAVWLIVGGALEISTGLGGAHHRGWLVFLGLIDIALGVILFFAGPASALIFLAFIIGTSFIFRGVFLCIFALRLRKLAD